MDLGKRINLDKPRQVGDWDPFKGSLAPWVLTQVRVHLEMYHGPNSFYLALTRTV
jgi:hypothetical protein